jgi:tRNA(Arg) A34 adenosine deaminase TadA
MSARSFFKKVHNPYEDYTFIDDYTISNKDASFIAAASKIAKTSDNKFRVGALIVKSGRVLGGSPNITRVSPKTPPNRFSTHAEIAAMNIASETDGATLYIARLNSENKYAMSKPCAWCMQKIKQYEINRVVFTTDFFSSKKESISSFYINDVLWTNGGLTFFSSSVRVSNS